MAKTLGYMITFTTYGTWLQGDERGYVKNEKIHPANKSLMQANKQLQVQDAVKLSDVQQQIVKVAIIKEATSRGQKIYALSIQPTHVHIVIEHTSEPVHRIVAYYKSAARVALKGTGHIGKLWTRGYDKRFCFNSEELEWRIQYVVSQNPA